MLEVVRAGSPDALEQMATDPFGVLRSRADVQVAYVESAQPGCGVHGSYDGETTPPTLQVRRTYARHEAFTVLHEFGHHVQQALDDELGAAVIDHPEADKFEELACEAFAALVLLPDDLVAELTPAAGASAETVAAYYANSRASRSACAVRALPSLIGGGVIAVLNDDGVVRWAASSSNSVFPPARGSDQSQTPLVARALQRRGDVVAHDETFLRYSTHDGGDVLYGQACWIEGWLVLVLKTDSASWRQFAPPRPRLFRPRPASAPAGGSGSGSTSGSVAAGSRGSATSGSSSWRPQWGTCTTCTDSFRVTDDTATCPTCAALRCDKGHCECTAGREVRCSQCFSVWGRGRFAAPDAPSPVCRDCDED